ncbi:hypothetical protein CYY_002238 [Polysphondylium violaceum]|uniref:Uncharacterized protein n=1 Tax=Polysphondylium violaceum TaxID=133409 RepID=A0A8J4PZF4_9MYCE|nr:hypothetical protein CYY_002238 [Polysphondylium violaceum]
MNDYSSIDVIENLLSTSLGPKGLDKVIIVDPNRDNQDNIHTDDNDLPIIITNDGATIMKNILIEHPLGQILRQLSLSIDKTVGDGTTSGVLLACRMIKETQYLLNSHKYHPNTIISSFQIASDFCKRVLDSMAIDLGFHNQISDSDRSNDHSSLQAENLLKQIISTSLSSKVLVNYIPQFTDIILDSISCLRKNNSSSNSNNSLFQNLSNIKYVKILGGSISNSRLVKGVVVKLDKPFQCSNINQIANSNNGCDPSSSMTRCKVLFINFEIGYLQESSLQLLQFNRLNLNIKVFFNLGLDKLELIHQSIGYDSDCPIHHSLSVLKKDKDTIHPIGEIDHCKLIVEKESEYYLEIVNNDKSKISTIVIKSPSIYILEEVQRSLNDSISIVTLTIDNGKVIPGGGCSEIELSIRLQNFINSLEFKQLFDSGDRGKLKMIQSIKCIECFIRSLETIPSLLIRNSGYDWLEGLETLKQLHRNENKQFIYYSLDLDTGKPKNMFEKGVVEVLNGKKAILKMVVDTVSMITKIDEIIHQ